jgi:HTH-type transcriptional regulator, quorum sensing regulator NprR
MTIGEKIKQARKSLGLTQQQLGDDQFTKGYISQIEKGTVEPSMKVLSLIASKLSKPLSYFLDEEDGYYKLVEDRYIEGENLYHRKNFQEAMNIFNEISQQNSEAKGVIPASSLLYLGKCLFNLKQYTQSLEVLTKTLNQLSELELLEKQVDCYFYMGLCCFDMGDYNNAIEFFQKGLVFIEQKSLQIPNHTAKLQLNTGTAYINLGRLSKAVQVFEGNIRFCKKEKINDTLLDCYIRLGYTHYRLGNLTQAKDNIIMANSVNQGLKIDIIWAEIYNVLGMIVYKEGHPQKGMKLVNKSMDICNKINYPWGYFVNIVDMIEILVEDNDLQEAEILINKYHNDIAVLEDKKIYYRLLTHKARLHSLRGDINQAIDILVKSVDKYIEHNMMWEVYHYAKMLADILIGVDPQRAKGYFDLSFQYLGKVNS